MEGNESGAGAEEEGTVEAETRVGERADNEGSERGDRVEDEERKGRNEEKEDEKVEKLMTGTEVGEEERGEEIERIEDEGGRLRRKIED